MIYTLCRVVVFFFFFFKQKTAYEMRISDWSSDVCSSDLWHARHGFCANCGGATTPFKAGWARSCGGCGAEHFPRVDPVVIMIAEHDRSEERRVGKECVSTCRSRWSPYPSTKKTHTKTCSNA